MSQSNRKSGGSKKKLAMGPGPGQEKVVSNQGATLGGSTFHGGCLWGGGGVGVGIVVQYLSWVRGGWEGHCLLLKFEKRTSL